MSLTFTDIFCGAGGSSIGLAAAGLELRLAANHWNRAIETHSANFTDAEHLCADVSNYDMRRLPRTDVLWASPICTELSPAGGRRRRTAQLDLLEQDGPVGSGGLDRTRATFWDVIRATEVHRYPVVLIENVVEAAEWELFDIWLSGMTTLGYSHQFVSVSSAHVGSESNQPAPQWRDRLYIVFTAKGVPAPDVRPRPLAWCPTCDELVNAVQSWKQPNARQIGRYGRQYVYRCPNGARCRHQVVEPFVLPAASVIDWSNLGTRIGDRRRPLVASTMRRIQAGLDTYAAGPPFMMAVNHGGSDGRHYLPYTRPLPTRTVRIGDGLVTPLLVPAGGTWNTTATHAAAEPMRTRMTRDTDALVVAPLVGELRRNGSSRPADLAPLQTVAAGGNHHYLVAPGAFVSKHHGGLDYPRIEHMNKPVDQPFGAVVAKPNMSLVIPYRKGSTAYPAGQSPISTVATREQHGLASVSVSIEDAHFRMLTPREHLRSQRFPDSYIVTGNGGEQTMQAGNAVSSNVAQWIGEGVIVALDSRSAA